VITAFPDAAFIADGVAISLVRPATPAQRSRDKVEASHTVRLSVTPRWLTLLRGADLRAQTRPDSAPASARVSQLV
jgi:hypothetical protein